MTLVKTLVALEQRDHATALHEALDAWATCKHERISAVIEELSKRVAKPRQPLDGKNVVEKQAAWLALAAKRDPADLPHLLSTLTEVKKRPELDARLAALDQRADPRIATALHRFLEHLPIPGATGVDTMRRALRLVVAIGDRRSLAALEHIRSVNQQGGGNATAALSSAVPGACQKIQSGWEPRLAVADAGTLDAIERVLGRDMLPKRSPADLFAAVYASPDDDQPRSVLADLMQEAGDPRGEFIALQLARARNGKRTRRETTLFEQHARTWLGPISPVVRKEGMVFERGFLTKCSINDSGVGGAAVLASYPEWATVEEAKLVRWQPEHVQALMNAMPVLRVLSGVEKGAEIPSHPRLEQLSVESLFETDVDHLCSRDLPSLRSLSISHCHPTIDQMVKFLSSPIGTQVRRLALNVSDAEEWIPVLSTRKLERAIVSQTGNPWRLCFEGDRITCSYHDGGHSRSGRQAAGELMVYLASVINHSNWHVTIRREVETLEGLAPTLNLFASHMVEPV